MKNKIFAYSLIFLINTLSLLSLSSCGNSKLPRYSIIQGLRVLALTLDQPEINYDGMSFTPSTVNLTPTISDLYSDGRALQYNLEWCVDPGIALGAIPTCGGNPSRVVVAQNQAVAATATFLAPNYSGMMSSIAISLGTAAPAAQAAISAAFARESSYQQFNGLGILIFFELFPSSEPSSKITTFKRLILSSTAKVSKNQNPSGLSIKDFITNLEISSFPSIQTSLIADLPAAQAESYFEENSAGQLIGKTETLETEWFFTGPLDVECSKKKECSSDGYFKLARSKPNELNLFYPPTSTLPSARGRVLIAVTHDSRGGNTVKRYCDGICP
jgi:hypothetical protein